MENRSKAETFIGFAIRAGKFRSGANTLSTLKKAYLILVCETASENTVKLAGKYAEKYRAKALLSVGRTLSDVSHKEGIKIAAITDFSLAKAVAENAAPDFKEIEKRQTETDLT